MPIQRDDEMVDHPPHYNQGKVECIEAIIAATGDGAQHYLQGNIMKYIWRYRHRHGLQDLQKAKWYLNALIDLVKTSPDPNSDIGKEEVTPTEFSPSKPEGQNWVCRHEDHQNH